MRIPIICTALVAVAFSIIVQAKRPTPSKQIQISWLQQMAQDIVLTPDYSKKIDIFKKSYDEKAKLSVSLVDEIGTLLDQQDELKQTLKGQIQDNKDYTLLEQTLETKQNLLSQYNQFLVIFKPVKKLFVDKKEDDELNCDSIQQKINFGLSDSVDYREYSDAAKKIARDLCAYKEADRIKK